MSANTVNNHLYLAQAIIADPGNAGTLVIEKSLAVCNLVSATAETRTLGRPVRQGVIISLHHYTDGGNITLTVTGGFNEDGETTFTFSDPGQFAVFQSFYDGTNYYWRKLSDYAIGNLSAAALAILDGLDGLTATVDEINHAADVTGQIVPLTTTPIAITEAAHNNRTMYITKTDGIAITLPVPVAGMKFKFVVGATIGTASTIKSVAGTHVMIGYAIMGNDSDNTTVRWPAIASSTYDTIDLLGTGNSTGGIEGQTIMITALSTTRWLVEIVGDAAGTEATPFQDTVT